MGALASGGVRVLNHELVREFGVSDSLLDHVVRAELDELARREHAYRGWVPPADLRGHTVIIVDDGLATGATMRAAIIATQQRGASRVIVAAPVGAVETCHMLLEFADEVVCLTTPVPFTSVGACYDQFEQLRDDDVRDVLQRAHRNQSGAAPAGLAAVGR
jgi:putative phosphoribosyl transferase